MTQRIIRQIHPPKWPRTEGQRQAAISRHLKTNKQQLLQRCHAVLHKTPGARTDKELQLLVDFTVTNNFFKDKFEHVGDSFHVELCRRIRHRNCRFEEYIIRQGEIGDEMYVIISGAVRVELQRQVLGEDLGRAQVLVTLGPGDGFGELALLNDVPRAASCIVSSLRCEVMVIQRKDFAEVLQKSHVETLRKRTEFLRAIPLFRTLTEENLVVIASHMIKHQYGRHQIIVKENDHADGLFILTKGTARVFKKADENVLLQLSVLHTGDIFGELGVILPGFKRTASVVAESTKTECLELSRSDFFQFLGYYQDLMLDECLSRYPTDFEILHQVAQHQKWVQYKKSLHLNKEKGTKRITPLPPPVSVLRQGSGLNAIEKLRKHRRRQMREDLYEGEDQEKHARNFLRLQATRERRKVNNTTITTTVYSTDRALAFAKSMVKSRRTELSARQSHKHEEAAEAAERQLTNLRRATRRNSLDAGRNTVIGSGSASLTHVLRHTVAKRFARRLSLNVLMKKKTEQKSIDNHLNIFQRAAVACKRGSGNGDNRLNTCTSDDMHTSNSGSGRSSIMTGLNPKVKSTNTDPTI